MQRQEGYYWVKSDGKWIVMEYENYGWECEGGPLPSNYFSEVNETRIPNPDENMFTINRDETVPEEMYNISERRRIIGGKPFPPDED